jgi:hypothetical protein
VSIEDMEARIVDVERKYETLRLAVLEWGKGFDTHGRLIDKLWQRIEALEAAQRPPHQDKLDRLMALNADDGEPIVLPSSRAALAQPVPVSERLPEFSHCDHFERVWAWNPVLDHWTLCRLNTSIHTHWLPHWALPMPAPANTINQEDY